MRIARLAALAALVSTLPGFAAHASPMAMDRPVTIDGIEAVCTGIGDEAQNDPRWKAYPIRVEFSNKLKHYLSGAHVTLKDKTDKTLATVDCPGAWVLFKVEPGSYQVTASLLWQKSDDVSAAVDAPATGQKRVVLSFPVGD